MTDIGPIPVHSCDLVEAHTVLTRLSADADAACDRVMHDWCEAHSVAPMSVHKISRRDHDGQTFVGYSFTVTVGRGQLMHPPGVNDDEWTFSARRGFWGRLFQRIDTMPVPRKPEQRTWATVTPIKRTDT